MIAICRAPFRGPTTLSLPPRIIGLTWHYSYQCVSAWSIRAEAFLTADDWSMSLAQSACMYGVHEVGCVEVAGGGTRFPDIYTDARIMRVTLS